MRSFKDIGIPFKQTDISESDRIISILTKYHGRVDAIAKGVRKPTSRKGGNVDIMTLSRFSFARGKNLDIITEVEQIYGYDVIKQNLDSTLSVFFICELIDKLIHVGSNEKESFILLLNLLAQLEQSKNSLSLFSFAYKLLSVQGYNPEISNCLLCDKPFVESEDRYIYNIQVGMVCSKHKTRNFNSVSNLALKVLRFVSVHDIKDSRQINVDDSLEKELRNIFQQWIEGVTEKELKSSKYLKNI